MLYDWKGNNFPVSSTHCTAFTLLSLIINLRIIPPGPTCLLYRIIPSGPTCLLHRIVPSGPTCLLHIAQSQINYLRV